MKTLLAAALLAASFSPAYAQTPGRVAVILRFDVATDSALDWATLPAQACLQTTPVAGTKSDSGAKIQVDPQVLDAITGELQKRLSKKMITTMDPDPKDIPLGAIVITGCITRADPGDPAGRMVGMTLGTSHLEAHVKILTMRATGLVPLDEFDVQAKGGKLLPPIGVIGIAVHAVDERRETLTADATRLADELLKKLADKLKSQAQAAKSA